MNITKETSLSKLFQFFMASLKYVFNHFEPFKVWIPEDMYRPNETASKIQKMFNELRNLLKNHSFINLSALILKKCCQLCVC